jgi:ferritin-like metal-binding protein YciE
LIDHHHQQLIMQLCAAPSRTSKDELGQTMKPRTEWTQQQSVKIESWTNRGDHAQGKIKDRIRRHKNRVTELPKTPG